MRSGAMGDPIIIKNTVPDSRSLIMPHQQEAVDALTEYFQPLDVLPGRSGLVVMPTGSGKTYTAVTWLMTQGIANGYRVVWLVHRQELVEQTYQEFRKQSPLLIGSGVEKVRILAVSGQHMKMSAACRADIYVCSIASVANKYGYRFIERMIGTAGKRKLIIVVDEAHHAVSASYQKVIGRMTSLNQNRLLLGLTATPNRMQESEQKKLQRFFNIDSNIRTGKGKHGYIYEVTLKQLLQSGFLAKPYYEKVNTQINGDVEYDLSAEDAAFFEKFGELTEKIKHRIGRSSVRNKIILNKYLENRERYGKTLIFALDQAHAETLCNEFRDAGISCDYVVSSKPGAQDTIRQFKENKFQVLINVQIMTEGSDVPDIQTVFLTRETNSDSLLMQMIGRGLRGPKAHGTKDAYIVAFHDVWTRFVHFMDPGSLDVFEEEPEKENEIIPSTEEKKPEIEPNEAFLALLERLGAADTTEQSAEEGALGAVAPDESEISTKELYLKLYALMRANLTSSSDKALYPVGWYSVINEDGNDVSLLVFENQLKAYKDIENNLSRIKGLSVDAFSAFYFGKCQIRPGNEETAYLLDYIEGSGEMPPYFTFEQREALDPKIIADKVCSLFEKDSDREEWMKKLFESAPVLQKIYKYFFAFKKTVFDAMKEETESVISTADEREEYAIVENYYDLSELLNEVTEMYPKLHTDGLVKISWTDHVIKNYFAQCERFEGGKYYQLYVNKLLSSPDLDKHNGKEVIKYLIFHELLHENGYWAHDEEFRSREWQYPDSAELDGILDSLQESYRLEGKFEAADEKHSLDLKTIEPTGNAEQASSAEESEPVKYNPKAKGVAAGFKYCRNCGNRLPEEAKFCDKCGSRTEY